MSLRLKFILVTLATSCLVAALGAWYLHRLQQEAFAAESRQRVELLADFGEAGRSYIWDHAARATMEHTDALVLETMSPAFAIRGLFDGFHARAPEYLYRSPSLNPSRREDTASPLEAGLIQRFDADRQLGQLSGFTTVDGQERFYVAKPIVTEQGCLACHGPAAEAPDVVTARYGTTSGYDWPLDRIINALVIYVPTADLQAFQRRTLQTAAATFLVSHLATFLLLYVLFERLVDRRLRRVAAVMDVAAAAPGQPAVIPDARGDEIGVVSRAFNRMASSLAEAYQTLERRVLERTRQLAEAKGQVEQQLARIDRELQAARELQLGIVPRSFPAPTPERPVEIAAAMVPATEVGGDLYDLLDLDDGRLCAVIGDVAGKGAAAALFMALALSRVRAAAPAAGTGEGVSGRILKAVNRGLCANNPSQAFVTMLVMVLDQHSGRLELASAGHLPPWRLGANGEVSRIPLAGAFPLGIDPDIDYATVTAELSPGEALFACTDGITEAQDPTGELFAADRVALHLGPLAGKPAAELVSTLLDAARAFEGAAPQGDDLTALVLRRVG